jgi:hypothetical protein
MLRLAICVSIALMFAPATGSAQDYNAPWTGMGIEGLFMVVGLIAGFIMAIWIWFVIPAETEKSRGRSPDLWVLIGLVTSPILSIPLLWMLGPTRAIAERLEAMHAAYWSACDAEGQAIDPAVLLAPNGVLDDAFHIAERVEAFAQDNGISWTEARERF